MRILKEEIRCRQCKGAGKYYEVYNDEIEYRLRNIPMCLQCNGHGVVWRNKHEKVGE